LGRFAEALAALDKAPAQNTRLQTMRAGVLAASGDRAAAQRLLAEIEKRFAAEPVPRGWLAVVHLALGDKDRAFEWLERAVEERDQSVSSLKVSPQRNPIRSDPRYHELLKRMNLE
jgi:Flp pilus assembly protein TadD